MNLDERRIAVIGLGYVGLPLAMEFAKSRPVTGFDIRRERIDELLAGRDSTLEVQPEDLRNHDCIALRENDEDVTLWRFRHAHGAAMGVRIAPILSSNAGATALEWARAGHGIVARSEWDVAAHLRARALVPLLAECNLPDANVVALVKSRQELSARTAGFLACLRAAFAAPPWREASA